MNNLHSPGFAVYSLDSLFLNARHQSINIRFITAKQQLKQPQLKYTFKT